MQLVIMLFKWDQAWLRKYFVFFCIQNTKILLQLEDKLRTDILHRLQQKEGAEAPQDISDINLDDYESDIESR